MTRINSYFVVVQLLSRVWLFATPWTVMCHLLSPPLSPSVCVCVCVCVHALSVIQSVGIYSVMSIELGVPSNHLILCHPLLVLPSIFPSIRVFPMSWLFTSGGQSIGASVSALPMSIQGWFPLGLTSLISLQSKRLSRVFSAPQLKSFNSLATLGKNKFQSINKRDKFTAQGSGPLLFQNGS